MKEEMRGLFNDIRNTDDFEGIMLFSPEGELMYQESLSALSKKIKNEEFWYAVVQSLSGIREAEMVYEKNRFYIRETEIGYLMIMTGMFAPIPKIRLYCDVILPTLNQMKTSKGLKRFFKKRK